MRIAIRLSKREEAQALPILLRHSPGIVLPDQTYVVSHEAAVALRNAGIEFTEISREAERPSTEEVASGERI